MVGVRGEARVLLNDDEKRMYAGEQGPAVQKAMDLLVRYGEALGAERLVDTQNVCGATSSRPASGRWEATRRMQRSRD
jgi:hypothetical protein